MARKNYNVNHNTRDNDGRELKPKGFFKRGKKRKKKPKKTHR